MEAFRKSQEEEREVHILSRRTRVSVVYNLQSPPLFTGRDQDTSDAAKAAARDGKPNTGFSGCGLNFIIYSSRGRQVEVRPGEKYIIRFLHLPPPASHPSVIGSAANRLRLRNELIHILPCPESRLTFYFPPPAAEGEAEQPLIYSQIGVK